MIKINGEKVNAKGMVLLNYLLENNFDTKRIAVELNENIVKKSDYANTIIKENDVIEVVSFVAGG